MTPAVSVVIATYNYGRFLGDALASALGQSFTDHEILVIDDGSTDETSQVVRPFLADRRVQYHRMEHLGQPAAKNVGIRLSRAPLVAFLDADDLWLPDKLVSQVALIREDPRLGMVHCRRLLIDEAGAPLQYEQPALPRGHVLNEMFATNFVCFSAALVRRDVLDAVGRFDERLPLAIDYDLWLRVTAKYPIDHVHEPLVKYRTGHASLSRRAEERLLTVHGIMRRFLDEHGGRALLPSALVRRAEAETCYHIALARRDRSPLAALPWNVRAVLLAPGYGLAWQGLFSMWLPESLRRGLRRLLGRPADWSVRQRIDEAKRRMEPCSPGS